MLSSDSSPKRRKLALQPDDTHTWDPGGPSESPDTSGTKRKFRDESNVWTTWDPGRTIMLPKQLQTMISTAYIGAAIIDELEDESDDTMENIERSRSELDTHANMPVVGKHAHILADTGKKAEVNAYTPDYDSMTIPIVDAAI